MSLNRICRLTETRSDKHAEKGSGVSNSFRGNSKGISENGYFLQDGIWLRDLI